MHLVTSFNDEIIFRNMNIISIKIDLENKPNYTRHAHTEPICKRLRIAKIVDMFQISIWKFYYTLINSMLPSYFE